MPEITIVIGGRDFEVACREGEEHFLVSAAAMLDEEARTLHDSIGRVPEPKMLLMSGLMLADRTAALEEQVDALKAEALKDPVDDSSAVEKELLQSRAEVAALKAALAESEAKMAQTAAEQSDRDRDIALAKQDAAGAVEAKNAAMAALNRMVDRVEAVAENIPKAG